MSEWQPAACILCECNCGIEVQLGGDNGRRLTKFRGDKKHPVSLGYACEKPHRLDHYQNGDHRLTQPLRRRQDGSFEEISWDTAISEIAARLARLRDDYGGESIFYYGGGGQGNHLPGAYATATRRALGSRFRSAPLAQEKTGEFWIADRVMGAVTRADFEHCDVALFIGKNPWYSHSIQRARVVLKEISSDPERTLIVIDPRVTKTAALADIHLQVKPGRDAWLVSAIIAVLLQEGLVDNDFIAKHAEGYDDVAAAFGQIPVDAYCEIAGVAEALVRKAARAIGSAQALSSMEDLGVQMNHHSTLLSYLHHLLWLLTGNMGKPGTHYAPLPLVNFVRGASGKTSPVVGAPIIGGLTPCNLIPDEILTDHPKRYRAMIVESANPVHSLADSARMREAFAALDTVVVIDVAMSETARAADYVLPASSQFEKAEATFFNLEFPRNHFQLRPRLITCTDGPLPEAEIHARLVEELGALSEQDYAPLRAAAPSPEDFIAGLPKYMGVFMTHVLGNPKRAGLAPVLLYRTLGPVMSEDRKEGVVLLALAMQYAMKHPKLLLRAGFEGGPGELAVKLFAKIYQEPTGIIFAVDDWDDMRNRVLKANKKVKLALDDMLAEVATLAEGPPDLPKDYPLVLSAGERRAFTANTIMRNPHWRRKDPEGALRIHPDDAAALGLASGEKARLTTARGSADVFVAVTDTMQTGHISLPNGLGLTHPERTADCGGIAPNELTDVNARDPFVGTPWHKHVPARLERL